MSGLVNILEVHAQPCSASQSPAWRICGPIESSGTLNIQPSIVQASDGTLNMAWTSRAGSNNVIFYASGGWNGTGWSWSPGGSITSSGGKNQNPSIIQLPNGTLYMFWSYKPTGSPNYQLYYVKQNGGLFSKAYTRVTAPAIMNDTLPSAAVGRDGTLWLTWTRDNTTGLGTGKIMRQLWYKTLKGNFWSTEQPLTSANDINWNFQPSVMVGKDNIVRVAFSKGLSSSNIFDIYDITYNGSVWTAPFQITTQTTTTDSNPSLMQDRNGTFWLFWSRNVQVSNNTAYTIYSKSSTNPGSTWTSETALTAINCPSSGCVDNENPAAVQSSRDKNIWVFYASNPVSAFNIYGLQTTSPIAPVHDVAIVPYTTVPLLTYIFTNTSQLYPGGLHVPYGWVNGRYSPIDQSGLVNVIVIVQNTGDFNETVTLKLYATNTTITLFGTSVFQLSPGAETSQSFNWNTNGFKPARYGITVNASIPIETSGNKPDGIVIASNLVHLLPPGDVDQDGSVTITDVTVVFSAYNFTCFSSTTCSPQFMAAQWADVDGGPIIDIVDATVAAHNFNTVT